MSRAEARFQNEFRLWAACDHPNIVGFRQLYSTALYHSVVMNLAAGGELFDRIVKHEHFCERLAAHCTMSILRGLAYLHDTVGIIHRDIKPENLLLAGEEFREDGSGEVRILICDFGIAARAPTPPQLLTEVSGTPGYIAPEVLSRTGYSSPVDLWGTGTTLYIMLCGEQPFAGETPKIISELTLNRQLSFGEPCWANISPAARSLVTSLLDKNAAQRPTAAQALQHPWFSEIDRLPTIPHVPEPATPRMGIHRAPEIETADHL